VSQLASEYLTTRELAELLHIKERKVYDLAASGEVPCSRATGKLLFPRHAVHAWIAGKGVGLDQAEPQTSCPNVFLGSHDPLLEWALRESDAEFATFFDGSSDGLERFARSEGMVTALHLYEPDTDDWNVPVVRSRFGNASVVLVEFAWRERGLIVPADDSQAISGLSELAGKRMVPRQSGAGSQALLDHLVGREGLTPGEIRFTAPARTETDAALAVLEGKADAAFGLQGLARQCRLAFVPIMRERFDLLVRRRAWFDPPMQRFVRFCNSPAFTRKAEELQGYDISGFGRVHFNGP